MSMSAQSNAIAFDLGTNAMASIKRSVPTERASERKDAAQAVSKTTASAKPRSRKATAPKGDAEEVERFQTFLPKSVKRRLKLFAAEEDMTLTLAMETLLTEALHARGV